MNRYEGSFVLVSHDRYFISKTANKIWEIVDHEIKEFKGGYEEWVAWKERMVGKEVGSKQLAVGSKQLAGGSNAPLKKEESVASKESAKSNHISDKSAIQKELQKQQRHFQKIEEELAKLNQEKTSLEGKLASPEIYTDKHKFSETEKKYKEVQLAISQLNKKYEEAFEQIMLLEDK